MSRTARAGVVSLGMLLGGGGVAHAESVYVPPASDPDALAPEPDAFTATMPDAGALADPPVPPLPPTPPLPSLPVEPPPLPPVPPLPVEPPVPLPPVGTGLLDGLLESLTGLLSSLLGSLTGLLSSLLGGLPGGLGG